jgi:hypothetical protein
MEEIDKPFRPTKGFMAVWAILTVVVLIFHKALVNSDLPWYSIVSFIVVVPFLATFFVWGPIMFLWQVRSSGSRGRFVFRMWLLTIAITAGITAILYFTVNEQVAEFFLTGAYGYVFFRLFTGCSSQPDPPKEPGFLRRE